MVKTLSDREETAFRDLLDSESAIENELAKLRAAAGVMSDLRACSRRVLREQEEQFKAVLDMSQAGIFTTGSADWGIATVNSRMAEIFDAAPGELIGVPFAGYIHPSETDCLSDMHMLARGEMDSIQSEVRLCRRDGSDFSGLLSARAISGEDGAIQRIVATIYDTTERRGVEEALSRIENNYWEIFNSTNDALFVHDAYSGAIVDVNQSVEKMFGYSREEMLFMSMSDISSGEDNYSLNEAVNLIRLAVEAGTQRYEWRCKRKDGELFWAEVALTASHIGGEGRVLAVFRDITDRKEIERRLQYLSAHDSLTGLYNRSHFETEFKRLAKGRKYPISIIVADLDGLKTVNDTKGHAFGDQLIKGAADILQAAFRADDLIARIGGDEFAVLLPEVDERGAGITMERIREEEGRFNAGRDSLPVRLSLGGATTATPEGIDNLFQEADQRMYADKAAHKEPGVACRHSESYVM